MSKLIYSCELINVFLRKIRRALAFFSRRFYLLLVATPCATICCSFPPSRLDIEMYTYVGYK